MDWDAECHETGEKLIRLEQVILDHWETLVRDVISASRHESAIILLDHVPDLIHQLIKIFQTGEIDETELGKAHGFHRAILTNYTMGDLLTEYSLLRESLMDYLYPMGNVECAKRVHKYIDILCKYSVIEFANRSSMDSSVSDSFLNQETNELRSNPIIDLQ